MDAINKFIGLRKSVFSETQETQTTPEQAPQRVSSTGVSSALDAFENFQASPLDLGNLTTPMTTEGDGITAPGPKGETLEASSFFDVLTADPSQATPHDSVIPKGPVPVYAQDGPAKVEAIKTPESEAISQMISPFKIQFQMLAGNQEKFHMVMENIYAPNYSREQGESLRHKSLAGDFKWLPEVEFVPETSVAGRRGVYSEGPPATIYLNNRLLKNPDEATKSFIRGVGYHLDHLTEPGGVSVPLYREAAGNEGEKFRAALAGEPTTVDPYLEDRVELVIDGRSVSCEVL